MLRIRIALGAALVVALGALLALGIQATPQARAQTGTSGTVVGSTTRYFQAATLVTTTATTPRTIGSDTDVWLTRYYHTGEFFIDADFATTGAVTVTVQSSPDGVLWTDGTFLNSTGTPVAASVVITNDGQGIIRYPLAGYYTRLKIVPSANVTTTIQGTLRNNGGS